MPEIPTEPLDQSLDSSTAINYLLGLYPKGLQITQGGEIVDYSKRERITDLARLSQIACEPRELVVNLRNMEVSLMLRGLTTEEAMKLDAMEEPRPPMKAKTDDKGRKIPGEEFDWEDKEFRKKTAKMFETKRAIIIATGLVGLQVPGNTPEQQLQSLQGMFPPQVLELLRERIMSLTSNALEIASFS